MYALALKVFELKFDERAHLIYSYESDASNTASNNSIDDGIPGYCVKCIV